MIAVSLGSPAWTVQDGVQDTVNTLEDEDNMDLGQCSLREAIIANNINKSFGGCSDPKGIIRFSPTLQGTITLIGSGLPLIIQEVVIKGPGPEQLAISGNSQFRVFDSSEVTLVIEGLTITEGKAPLSRLGIFERSGGGIRSQGSVSLLNTVIKNNSAGIDSDNQQNDVQNNGYGGGISARYVTVDQSLLMNNYAYSGGAIDADTTTVHRSILTENSALDLGGGISANTVVVSYSNLSGNSANKDGGGIQAKTVTVSHSTLSSNSAGENGGGISVRDIGIVNNSTLSGNSAGKNGGGIHSSGRLAVNSSTLILNRAQEGGGVFSSVNKLEHTLNNTIVAGNIKSNTSDPSDVIGVGNGSHNLIGTGGSGDLNNRENGNITGISLPDLKLSPLQENGGSIPGPIGSKTSLLTHELLPDSPAIDRGSNTLIPPELKFDQRGIGFERIRNRMVDIGSIEAQ
jgi:CSLREA domain-containing protein